MSWRLRSLSCTVASTTALVLAASMSASALTGDARSALPSVDPPDRTTSAGAAADLDVMFIGAHPDDEASTLSTFGQWGSDHDVRTGVITITRGEGGGNAVGPEEGPALGLLREAEERRAVGKAGISDVYNLDKVDFYYTVSEPLSRDTWGHEDTLARIVRILRQTRPEVIVTMNPAPSPGNHGNHQEAARLAVEAYDLAGDPTVFPEQITAEGLQPFSPDRVLMRTANGTAVVGPDCARGFRPADASQTIYGVWAGATAPDGRSWAAVERDAQRLYASQGWAGFPDVPTDPTQIGCDYVTLVDSRTPLPLWGSDAAHTSHAALDGALVDLPGGLPRGSRLSIVADRFRVLPGAPFTVKVAVQAPTAVALGESAARLALPAGWSVTGTGALGTLAAGEEGTATFTVTPAVDAQPGSRERLQAFVDTAAGTGYNDQAVMVSPAVTAGQELIPQVSQFQAWAGEVHADELADIVRPVLTLPSAGTRQFGVVVTNHGAATESGTVSPAPPSGFSLTPESASYGPLAPGASVTVPFTVTNTDTSLPTSVEGGTAGDYLYGIATTSSSGTATTQQAFELVPATTVPEAAAAPTVDGVAGVGEYPGPVLDISRRWEGSPCASPADCSGTVQVTWKDDTLFLLVHVTDDVRGTALDAADCKRHWRTDSVEIAIDPRGTSENTSSTFKAAVLPWTAQGAACYLRDADAHQGDGPTTAPGMRVAVTVDDPFTGYTVETAIPMSLLPSAIDPDHMGLNVFVYDSDTQDKTGQTRIGWSVWGGVQGDPYRWGRAVLAGYQPPAGRPTTPAPAVMPTDALSSLESPQSIEQSARTNVALAGRPASPASTAAWAEKGKLRDSQVEVRLRVNAAGTAHVFVVDGRGIAGSVRVPVSVSASHLDVVSVPLNRSLSGTSVVQIGWEDEQGRVFASETAIK